VEYIENDPRESAPVKKKLAALNPTANAARTSCSSVVEPALARKKESTSSRATEKSCLGSMTMMATLGRCSASEQAVHATLGQDTTA
jgi:hypothetical protein